MSIISKDCKPIPEGWKEDMHFISWLKAAEMLGLEKSSFTQSLHNHDDIFQKYANYRGKYHGRRQNLISIEGLTIFNSTKNVHKRNLVGTSPTQRGDLQSLSTYRGKQKIAEKALEVQKIAQNGNLYSIVEKMANQLNILTDEIANLKGNRGRMELPAPTLKLEPVTKRKAVNALVRDYAMKHDLIYSELFSELYRELYYRIGYDVRARWGLGSSKYDNKLEMIEADGKIEALYALACEKFI